MRDLAHIAARDLSVFEKRTIQEGVIHFFHLLHDASFPEFPFVDIGDEEDFLIGAVDLVAHCFGVFIAVWDLQGDDFHLVVKKNLGIILERLQLDILQLDQLRPGAVGFQVFFHFRHGINRYFIRTHHFPAQVYQAGVMADVRVGEENTSQLGIEAVLQNVPLVAKVGRGIEHPALLIEGIYQGETADHFSFFEMVPDFFAAVFFTTGVGEAAVLGDTEDGEVRGVNWVIGYLVIFYLIICC
jgi:hypothetical protein